MWEVRGQEEAGNMPDSCQQVAAWTVQPGSEMGNIAEGQSMGRGVCAALDTVS